MQDIVEKVDRMKELAQAAVPADDPQRAEAVEVFSLAIDVVGELVANSRRIAVALETIAENTKPMNVELASAELVSAPGWAEVAAGIDWSHIGFIMGQGFANGDRSAR